MAEKNTQLIIYLVQAITMYLLISLATLTSITKQMKEEIVGFIFILEFLDVRTSF